ncbi:MAG TPA: MFS transporter [Acidimicrobiia bacterium]|nr:MFS transporter [Acidimicrobiia bacterium]
MRSFSKLGLGAVTAATMATSTFAIVVASVLAVQLIDEFEISRAQIGVLALANGIVGALASPLFGRITDWLGSVRAVTGALVTGALTLSIWAVSPNYQVLVAGALLTGLANAWGNPSTNALIVDTVPAGDRGVVTGIKQSGVQIGTFLGGLLLPLFAGWWSWRIAILLFLALPIGGLIGMIGRHDVNRHQPRKARSTARLPVSVRWVAAYGAISGLATSAMLVFLPLFANEHLGWSETAGGAMVALIGFAGIFARVLWPRFSERRIGHGRTLRILAVLSTVSASLLALTSLDVVGGWALFPAVALLGGGAIAWNAVGMLAVMDFAPEGGVGKGTGFVLLGFLTGLALGPPLMGLSVDQLGTYTAGWIGAAVLLSFSALLSFRVPSGTIIGKT